MKKLLTTLLITSSFILFSQSSMAAQQYCTGPSIVSYMHAGGLGDGGHAMWVAFRNVNSGDYVKIHPNNAYNLNDQRGKALFSLLTLSLTADKVLKVIDNHDTNCRYFDEIRIYN